MATSTFEVKSPLAELHFVAVATEESLGRQWGLARHRHRGPLRPDAPKPPCGCYSDFEPILLGVATYLLVLVIFVAATPVSEPLRGHSDSPDSGPNRTLSDGSLGSLGQRRLGSLGSSILGSLGQPRLGSVTSEGSCPRRTPAVSAVWSLHVL